MAERAGRDEVGRKRRRSRDPGRQPKPGRTFRRTGILGPVVSFIGAMVYTLTRAKKTGRGEESRHPAAAPDGDKGHAPPGAGLPSGSDRAPTSNLPPGAGLPPGRREILSQPLQPGFERQEASGSAPGLKGRVDPEAVRKGHEPERISFRIAMLGFAFFSGFIAFVIVASWGLIVFFAGPGFQPAPAPLELPRGEFEAPLTSRLSTPLGTELPGISVAPRRELAEYRREQAERAPVYGWADRQAGLATIPVERAMEYIVQYGLPGWSGNMEDTVPGPAEPETAPDPDQEAAGPGGGGQGRPPQADATRDSAREGAAGRPDAAAGEGPADSETRR